MEKALKEVSRAIHHSYVFTYKGEPIGFSLNEEGKYVETDRGGLKKSFRTACKNSGITCGRDVKDGLIFHDIRRSVKTNMFEAGVAKEYRDKILGHSFQGMDAHYLEKSIKDHHLRAAMDIYTNWLDEQIKKARTQVQPADMEGTA